MQKNLSKMKTLLRIRQINWNALMQFSPKKKSEIACVNVGKKPHAQKINTLIYFLH